jgi:hypothetical protein
MAGVLIGLHQGLDPSDPGPGEDLPCDGVHSALLLQTLRRIGLEHLEESTESHNVDKLMGGYIDHERIKVESGVFLQGPKDLMILDADLVKIEPSAPQVTPLRTSHVAKDLGECPIDDFRALQIPQGANIVTGSPPLACGILKMVAGELLGQGHGLFDHVHLLAAEGPSHLMDLLME